MHIGWKIICFVKPSSHNYRDLQGKNMKYGKNFDDIYIAADFIDNYLTIGSKIFGEADVIILKDGRQEKIVITGEIIKTVADRGDYRCVLLKDNLSKEIYEIHGEACSDLTLEGIENFMSVPLRAALDKLYISVITKPTIFISYSHEDEMWKDRLVTHLGVLQQEELLDLWEDSRIGAGEDWFKKIQEATAKASVAILLISANFLVSEFIRRKEVPFLLERRFNEGLQIYPVIIRPCAWKQVKWLSKMNLRPKNGRAISGGNEFQIDTDLTTISEEVATIVQKFQKILIEEGVKESKSFGASKGQFKLLCENFFSQPIDVRKETAKKISELAKEMELNDFLDFWSSSSPGERVGAAIGICTHIEMSEKHQNDEIVINALRQGLFDYYSRVRFRIIEAIGKSANLVIHFEKELSEISESDENPVVKDKAKKILKII